MERIKLGRTQIETSSLGFGCVQLTAHDSIKDAVTTLECAFDSGITHFDVARSYGFGRCEGILSRLLKNKRERVTVATKFGIELPNQFFGSKQLIVFAKKMLKPFPSLLHRAKNHGASMVKCGNYDAASMINSLEKSLRELRTDYIDIFLLHEAAISDAADETLISALQKQVSFGKIRSFGIASDFEKVGKQLNLIPPAHHLLQFNDNVVDNNMCQLSSSHHQAAITHSVFKPLGKLLNAVELYPNIVREFSQKINIDLHNPAEITALLLHYALRSNLEGIVLFSSTNKDHIKKNIHIVKRAPFTDQQLFSFYEFSKIIFSKIVTGRYDDN